MFVKEVKENKVVVTKARTSACGSCPAKSICVSGNEINLEAEWNEKEQLKPGDEVIVDIPEYDPMKVSAIVYFVPLVIFAAVVITGYSLNWKDWLTFFSALGGVFVYYSLLRFRKKDKKPPRIIGKAT
ncbi:positive regulator of sigma E, RseC/MucC [Thermotoga neapolitana DSM 4359]|jgi:sigma-E factor negative regulatory protein RseC|nr:sigma-E factor negative regulatory protein RseC [Thermotoga sp.]MDK2949888.1 sigma-E factor negative regulatory protein RseC [Thermotoga sp.]HBF11264.1 Fis family transcriptional regulator [Thermotoga neapolitana]